MLTSAAFSPDGKRVVTASADKTARVWDPETGTQIALLKGHMAVLRPPPSARTASASSPPLRTRPRASGTPKPEPVALLKGHDGGVTSAAFSPDGKRVVTASDGQTARVWDPETGTQIALLKGHDGGVTSAAFSPDGKRVVTASEDEHGARLGRGDRNPHRSAERT